MRLLNKYPPYLNKYMTIPELFNYVDFGKVVDDVVKLLGSLDKMNPTDGEAIRGLIMLTFGMLGEEDYLPNLISRWPATKSKAMIENYMTRMLYDATIELWMKKQFLNASMNWDTLNDLLSRDVVKSHIETKQHNKNWTKLETSKDEGTNNRKNTGTNITTGDSQLGNFQGAGNKEANDEWVRKNEYFAGGQAGKDNNTLTLDTQVNDVASRTTDNQDKGCENESDIQQQETKENTQQVKLDYLEDVYKFIERNSYLFERYFGAFVFSLIWTQQNPETDNFPWPWSFSNRSVIW